ncbi:MAG: tRNA preQ1(34) S-adenosylmethionine ribosyltransferase-isomerase QueA [Rhodospirillaceae bacterium]|nr:tRNA preQ1(34) S-adenosylmethionine ribosyltransferase-isomerase QueA [Rhodospirillaceae bacterium]
MRVDDFDFALPKDRIAQAPARPRDSARLLCVGGGVGAEPADRTVRDLPALLRPGDLLVMNDTKVIPARLRGIRSAARGEAGIEITLHRQLPGERGAETRWLAFARPGRRLKLGDTVRCPGLPDATVVEKRAGGEVLLAFEAGAAALLEALDAAGEMPLPPYIARTDACRDDREDYQTVYARERGAVAAPTAGLHFTERLLEALAARGVGHVFVTLHVGAGTFLPVKAERVADHRMHAETGTVSAATAQRINDARAAGGRIVAVGTTSLRLLESCADDSGRVRPFAGETDIFIVPGSPVRSADLLLTNFHLPRSTLFMLVCAFAGTARMKAAYAHAVETGYRFYSYGDACLLEHEK